MPPKESRDLKNDITEVIGYVKAYWPDFVITSEDLTHPTAQFVTRFYTSVYTEIKEKFSYLLGEDAVAHEPTESKDFDSEVHLFCAVSRIFRSIRVNAFCLNDIYRPVPKRTRFFIRSVMHFLSYIEGNMQHFSSLTDSIFKKVDERQRLHEEKQELLQEINETAESIAKADTEREKLMAEKEEISVEHRKILNAKHLKDKLYADKQLQIEKITNECENEEYQLKCLEQEEMTLKEQVVTEEDFKDLKEMQSMLESELARLSQDHVALEDGLGAQKENLQSIESLANTLSNITLDGLAKKVEILQVLEDQKKKQDSDNFRLGEENKHLHSAAERLKEEAKRLSDVFRDKEHQFEALKKQVHDELEHLKDEHEAQKNKTLSIIKKSQDLQKTIHSLTDDISEIKTDQEYFKERFSAEYKQVLDTQRHVINRVSGIFDKIKALGEEKNV